MGFGTGLNCFISFLESQKRDLQIEYVGLEGYPLDVGLIEKLKYPEALKALDFRIQSLSTVGNFCFMEKALFWGPTRVSTDSK